MTRWAVVGLWLALGVDPQDLLKRESSPSTTGQIEPIPFENPGTAIAPPELLGGEERRAPVIVPEQAPAPPAATRAPLDETMRARLDGLRDCRNEVALERHVRPRKVRAETLELRWIVLASGGVEAPEVVLVRPADGELVSCVKRKMAGWRFAPPPLTPAGPLTATLGF